MKKIVFDYIPFGVNVSDTNGLPLGTIEHDDKGFWFEDNSLDISSPIFENEKDCIVFVEQKLSKL